MISTEHCVLVVEDSRTQAEFARGLLFEAGYTVRVVASGAAALTELQRFPCDLVLADLHLPGISGFDLCRAIKDSPSPRQPSVVIVTADPAPKLVLQGLEVGADAFLHKGSLQTRLHATVKQVLHRANPTAGAEPEGTTAVQFFGDEYFVRSERGPLLDVLVTAFEESLALTRELERSRRRVAETSRGEANLRQLLHAFPDALVVVRADRIVFGNQALLDAMGATSTAELAATDLGSRAATERDRATLRRLLREEGDDVRSAEVRLSLRDGALGTFKLTAFPIVFDDDAAICLVAADVSELRGIQAGLAHADRLASVGSLAAGVAHEVNNPLTYVMHALDQISHVVSERRSAAGPDPDLELERGLAAIEKRAREALHGATRIRDIVAELRTLSQVQNEERSRPVDVHELCRLAMRLANHQVRHSAKVELQLDPVPMVLGNDGRLVQVLINLLINASQAIGSGGGGVIQIVARSLGGRVVIEVQDDGPGIPADRRAHLFDPFFTTKAAGDGSGLGLWICRRIVEEHRGTLEVRDRPGGGAIFTVDLPGHDPADSGKSPSSASWARAAPGRSGRVLLVEDEIMVRRALARSLRQRHEVVAVASVKEAQEAIRGGGTFDAVLCDLMLGEQSGADLYDWLCTEAPEITSRFVVVSGGAVTERTRDFVAREHVQVLAKPIGAGELEAKVQELLETQARAS